MATTTNTKTNENTTPVAPTTPSTTSKAATIGPEAGALWTALIKLTSLNNELLKDFQQELLDNLDMEIGQSQASAQETLKAGQSQAMVTKIEAYTSLGTAASTLAVYGGSAIKDKFSSDSLTNQLNTANKELTDLQGIRTNKFINGTPHTNVGVGDVETWRGAAGNARSTYVKTRIDEMRDSPAGFDSTRALDDATGATVGENTTRMRELDERGGVAEGDVDATAVPRDVYSQMHPTEFAQARVQLDKRISTQEERVRNIRTQQSDATQNKQTLTQLLTAVANCTGGLMKADFQVEAANHQANSALASMEQQVSGQAEQNIKSAMDKASQGITSAVDQYKQAISAVYRG